MWNFQEIVKLKYVKDYTYYVEYSDGLQGEVDFSGCLDYGPVFYPLKEITLFAQAGIEGGTIAWPNGADIAPEALYDMLVSSNQLSGKR